MNLKRNFLSSTIGLIFSARAPNHNTRLTQLPVKHAEPHLKPNHVTQTPNPLSRPPLQPKMNTPTSNLRTPLSIPTIPTQPTPLTRRNLPHPNIRLQQNRPMNQTLKHTPIPPNPKTHSHARGDISIDRGFKSHRAFCACESSLITLG
jgi:hypothetical protein